MDNLGRLRNFVVAMTRLVDDRRLDEDAVLRDGKDLLRALVASDDWLPSEFAVPSTERYRQYLLYCDPAERFCIVSFVWLQNQKTPIHDHLTWGLIGQLRGEEVCDEYEIDLDGVLQIRAQHRMRPGDVDCVSPRIGDVHAVSQGGSPDAAVSIHVYGSNIGSAHRHVYEAGTGIPRAFMSGYDNEVVPNLWNRSKHP